MALKMINSIMTVFLFISGVVAFAYEFRSIKFKYGRQTPFGVRAGSVIFATGALFAFIDPTKSAVMMVFGKAIYGIFNRRERKA